MNQPEIPRLPNGGPALCHPHQCVVADIGGLNAYLIKMLRKKANIGYAASGPGAGCPFCGFERSFHCHTHATYRYGCSRCKRRWGLRVREHGNLSADKDLKVKQLLREHPEWSNTRIAEATGVASFTVRRRRAVVAEE